MPVSAAADPVKPAEVMQEAPQDAQVDEASGTTTPASVPVAAPLAPDLTKPAPGAVVPGVIPGVQPVNPLPPGGTVAPPMPADGSAELPGMVPTPGLPTMPSDPLGPQPGEAAAPTGVEWDGAASADADEPPASGWEGFVDALQVFGYDSDFTARSGSTGLAGGFGAPGFATNPLLEGFRGTASVRAAYDSNASMGYGPTGDDDEFYSTYAVTLAYRSRAATWNYGGYYSGGYNWFFDNDDLSGYNQRAGAGLYYTPGGAFSAYLTLGLDYGSGANRYYASIVDETSYSASLGARYAFSPKTSLVGSASVRGTVPDGSNYNETMGYNLGLSGMWRYSERTEFGPGVRYSFRTGDSQEDRQSIGPTFTVNYAATAKIRLHARLGVDFVDYENSGSGDASFSTSLGANYQASELWGMKLAVLRDTDADPSWNQGYTESTTVRLGYYRRISRATLNLGASYEFEDTEMPDSSRPSRADRDYFALDGSLGMPVFAESCYGFLFMRYSNQDGGSRDNWDSFQGGVGLSYAF